MPLNPAAGVTVITPVVWLMLAPASAEGGRLLRYQWNGPVPLGGDMLSTLRVIAVGAIWLPPVASMSGRTVMLIVPEAIWPY